MARIPESEIERLKNEVSVERLVENSGIALKKYGKDLTGCCPFHEDATASLIVTPAKNLWHCFGCGIGGGPIDWVMKNNGVSFRHAVELLREGLPSLAADGAGTVKRSTVRALPPPVSLDADDQTLLNQVIGYYHATLKSSPEALAYLESRGFTHPELIDTFQLGLANRTLGLRLPAKSRVAGNELRTRLQRIGIYRESGHEHFNGSLVIPVFDEAGNVVEVYGRKVRDDLRPGTPTHLYLPGPHAGVFNRAALLCEELIVCEALIDALTFWCAGFRNVTSAYGVEGVTDELIEAIKASDVKRVLIAFDRDEAGERGATKLAEKLLPLGLDCYRIQFPKGMDANEYALKVAPAEKSLGLAIRKAVWLGKGEKQESGVRIQESVNPLDVPPADSSLAAGAASPPQAASSLNPESRILIPELPASPVPPAPACEVPAEVSEAEIVLTFADRRYRVRGLAKNLSHEVLKVNVLASMGEAASAGSGQAFHVDTLDLYHARARASYIAQAAIELRLGEDIIKTDLGRVLLKLEALQDEQIKQALTPKEPARPDMTDADKTAALELLQSPDLLNRILSGFEACGLVGERTNKLVAYLAAVSRLLDRPLGVVIQSSSAAGKSSLMDAVLAFVPDEQKVKYSAMTGQSLFYMGETNLKHKCLAIVEEEGASRASYALKLLQSEGELTIASTGKDPNTGNLITQAYRVEGPVALLLTTTARDIDEELMNRCLVLAVDEGRAQTRAIHQRQRDRRTLQGLLARHDKAALIHLHQNAQRLLRPLEVLNPYAQYLTFPDQTTRLRRDHDKYLTLIDTIAFLHQHQREIKTHRRGGEAIEYIEATLSDIETANQIAHEVLGRSLDELPPQTRRLLQLIDGHVREQCTAQTIRRADYRFSRRALREAIAWGDTQLRLHLDRLAELEYVLAHREGPGGKYVYELAYEVGDEARAQVAGLIGVDELNHLIATMTRKSRGETPEVAGRSRADSGPVAAGSRAGEPDGNAHGTGILGDTPPADTKMRFSPGHGPDRSYPQPSLAATPHA